MKKKSRFLTGLLSAVMALSLCALPAMAANDGETPATTPPQDVWTQDTGSITIHKYEYNGEVKPDSTGEENDAKHLPEGATALKGATFSIYQVMDRAELQNYYDGTDGKDKVTVDTYLNEAKNAIKSNEKYSEPVDTKTTGADGMAKFSNLQLGLYVVVETGTPDKVTSPVKPFLVSVPMTKASSLNEWLYDIHVYPKNGTTYGEVKIVKTGRVGNGTENKLSGVTFTLEKWNETDGNWNLVTASDKDGKEFNLTTDTNGEISVSGLSQGKYRFIEQSIKENNTYIIDQTPIVFEVNKKGEIVYNGETKAAFSIPVINESPDVEKNVIKGDELKTDTDYSIGDEVPYQITVTVPKNITKLTTFTVSDTPNHLKYNNNAVLTCNGAAVDDGVYTIDTEGEGVPVNGFKITFTPSQMEKYAGQKIIIKYTATLQSDADQTTAGNRNDVSLVYGSKIGVDGKEGGQKEIHDSTFVYTFKVKVHKIADDTNADGTNKELENVEFDLYKKDEKGNVTGDAAKALGLDPTAKWIKVNKTSLKTNKEGYVEQGGLANGDYYLVETKTASGYNLLKAPVKVTLSIQETTTWTDTYIYNESGNMLKHTVDKKTTTFMDGDKVSDGVHTITVVNRKGFDLPTTGGFGTLLFSGIGALLVVGGVGVLMSTKKKKKGNA